MQIGMIGLGKMGGAMIKRLLAHGHQPVVWDLNQEAVEAAQAAGAAGATDIADLVSQLAQPRAVWVMVPAGKAVESTLAQLQTHLAAGDIIVDGGNSDWRNSKQAALALKPSGIELIDCGVSGGIWGLEEGYCLMYGGEPEACQQLEPVFKALAPPEGYQYCGLHGAGHFVKMVHNGIEYGMMQALAEGFELMQVADFDIDLPAVAKVWQQGSVIRCWLLELAANALEQEPGLESLAPFVPDSGEGRWAVETALELEVAAPVITQALFARFQSRRSDSFSLKLLSALRNQFGGHAVKHKEAIDA